MSPWNLGIPSGKHTKNYRKSPCWIGKLSINRPFSIAMLVYQRVKFAPGSLVLPQSTSQDSPPQSFSRRPCCQVGWQDFRHDLTEVFDGALGTGKCWRLLENPPRHCSIRWWKTSEKIHCKWEKTMLLYASFFENLDAENHLLSFHTVRGHFQNFERTFFWSV